MSSVKFTIMLYAETPYVKFEQPFDNIHDYLVRAQELEEMGFTIKSWHDKNMLKAIN